MAVLTLLSFDLADRVAFSEVRYIRCFAAHAGFPGDAVLVAEHFQRADTANRDSIAIAIDLNSGADPDVAQRHNNCVASRGSHALCREKLTKSDSSGPCGRST